MCGCYIPRFYTPPDLLTSFAVERQWKAFLNSPNHLDVRLVEDDAE